MWGSRTPGDVKYTPYIFLMLIYLFPYFLLIFYFHFPHVMQVIFPCFVKVGFFLQTSPWPAKKKSIFPIRTEYMTHDISNALSYHWSKIAFQNVKISLRSYFNPQDYINPRVWWTTRHLYEFGKLNFLPHFTVLSVFMTYVPCKHLVHTRTKSKVEKIQF